MGIPLREQEDNPHPDADKNCEGCWGSGWLTAMVDHPERLDEAGLDEPADFCMACDECNVFDSDEEAIEAARKAGMDISEYGVVRYTNAQRLYLYYFPW